MRSLFLQVNNAGASGLIVDEDGLRALNIDPADWVISYRRKQQIIDRIEKFSLGPQEAGSMSIPKT